MRKTAERNAAEMQRSGGDDKTHGIGDGVRPDGQLRAMRMAMENGERANQRRGTSNQKSKGQNNRKCGNKYLAWAFVEAANFARRYDESCRRWFDRKAARTKPPQKSMATPCSEWAKAGLATDNRTNAMRYRSH